MMQQRERVVESTELEVRDGCIDGVGGEIVVGNGVEHGLAGTESRDGFVQSKARLHVVVERHGEAAHGERSVRSGRDLRGLDVAEGRGLHRCPGLPEGAQLRVSDQVFAGEIAWRAEETACVSLRGRGLVGAEFDLRPVLRSAADDVEGTNSLLIFGLR